MQGKLVNLIFLLLSVWNEVIGGFYLGGTISWEPTIRFKDNLKEVSSKLDFRDFVDETIGNSKTQLY